MKNTFLLFLMLLLLKGVLHAETQEAVDEIVSVMEGQSVTLESGVTDIHRNDLTLWIYGDTRIAQMNKEPGKISLYDGDHGMFRGKIQLNYQTGSLTVTNLTAEHTGLYSLEIHLSKRLSKKFRVTVSAHLPVPNITKDSTQNSTSSSRCVLVCLVMNVTHATLSWYKENSLISSISVSDLNIRLSLPLEVEYQDNSTYSCVVNNPIRNQTQHLHITDVCGLIPAAAVQPVWIAVCVIAVLAVIGAVAGLYQCHQPRSGEQNDRATEEELRHLNNSGLVPEVVGEMGNDVNQVLVHEANDGQISGDVVDELDNVDGETSDQHTDSQCNVEDVIKTENIKEGKSITLHTDGNTLEEEIVWKFAKQNVFDAPVQFEVIAERTKATDVECSNGRFEDRLKVDSQTGSLTITKTTTEDSGYYKLLIPRKRFSKTFHVIVHKQVHKVQRRHTTDIYTQ